jgi:hypothetical protein
MAYTRNTDYRLMSNSRISGRAKQAIALVAAVVIGMIVSSAINALPSSNKVNLSTKATIITPSIRN